MQVFHCDHCQQLVFFENTRCVNCDHLLSFLPDVGVLASLEPAGKDLWQSPLAAAAGRRYRLCANYSGQNICNWAVPVADPEPLCESCRLTVVIPNLDRPGSRDIWYKLELAKRRMVYNLKRLGCPIQTRAQDPKHGLAYQFLADIDTKGDEPVLTGHDHGLITVNIAEADDVERERRRLQLHEPYRTLLGHFRHEVGHYYWDRLIAGSGRLNDFRRLFGDERADYAQALRMHYQQRPPEDWQQHFVSEYATAHPWEDWAETWAHYLHMTDTLETAVSCGLSLRPQRADEPRIKSAATPSTSSAFDQLIENWFPLTYVLNNLNRGMGLPDAYPFVLSQAAVEKLRFVHDTILAAEDAVTSGTLATEPAAASRAIRY